MTSYDTNFPIAKDKAYSEMEQFHYQERKKLLIVHFSPIIIVLIFTFK